MSGKSYTAITLDTSIFDGNALKLEKGLLGKLKQFNGSPTKFVLTDIVVNELTKHLHDKIITSRASLQKALEEANEHLFFDGSLLTEAKEKLIEGPEINELAVSRVKAFLEKSGAYVIDSADYVEVAELRDYYFNNRPPFATTGKKKNEFPDAIALLALEHWAEENEQLIYAVAKDGDWKSYCEESKLVDYNESLADALDYFNTKDTPFIMLSKLEGEFEFINATKFGMQLSNELGRIFNGYSVDQNGDSPFNWEPEGVDVTFVDFTMSDDKLKLIEKTDSSIVVEASIEVELNAEGEFSLYQYDSIDHDQVYLGSVAKDTTEYFNCRALITFVGDFDEAKEDITYLDIDSVEIIDKLNSIYFGYLELDYDDGE
ncbi:PIN domain-containing protein [Raoultella planticola]|uniref:PIN domain-containing protein n=1 Tax=Klebsiella/Raoultella group TaxID=2890311 RepID=UPI001781F65B|nr:MULTISPECIES: PIN domain-containing protein [Klebsiella/Raoultella group]MCQ6500146.1 PIN domain-containing protein [Raoultella planticola]MEA8784004.1 PIN domain-containing protein [Klebsiella aerogenes]QOF53218.1 DUF4935 domain-containing protein [Klebsiella quasipneumoniae]